MFGKNLGKFRVNLNLVLSTFFLRFSFSLDAKVLEIDFLEKFAKFAEPSNGLANAKQFARYLHLPVDHLKAMEIFGIYDSVCTVLYTMETPLFFFVFISLPTFVSSPMLWRPSTPISNKHFNIVFFNFRIDLV
jgi:hypothetical protein